MLLGCICLSHTRKSLCLVVSWCLCEWETEKPRNSSDQGSRHLYSFTEFVCASFCTRQLQTNADKYLITATDSFWPGASGPCASQSDLSDAQLKSVPLLISYANSCKQMVAECLTPHTAPGARRPPQKCPWSGGSQNSFRTRRREWRIAESREKGTTYTLTN